MPMSARRIALRAARTADDPDYYARQQRNYRLRDVEKARQRARDWYANNKARRLAQLKVKRDALRAEMLAAYGASCACCGESNPGFLTLDHMNNDGSKHRRAVTGRERAGNAVVLQDLKRRGWPREGFQLLCYNCNCGRAHRGGVCPHRQV